MKPPLLRREERGASAVEFALVAPLLLLMLFGIIVTALYFWQHAALNRAAFESARCAAIADTDCADEAAIRSHAVSVAEAAGVTVSEQDVTVELDTSCGGLSSMVSVSVAKNIANPTPGLLPNLPTRLVGESCLPRINRN